MLLELGQDADGRSRPTLNTWPLCSYELRGGGTINLPTALNARWSPHPGPAYRGWEASPFHMVTGLASDADAGRMLALAINGGLGEPVHATGHELVARIRNTIRQRAEYLDFQSASVDLLDAMAGNVVPPVDLDRAKRLFNRLLAEVRSVVPDEGDFNGWMVTYQSDELAALAAMELAIIRRDPRSVVLTCAHCGCLFVAINRTDEVYCRRPAPGEPPGSPRTCQKVGAQARYAETVDDYSASYRRTFKRLDNIVRRYDLDRSLLDGWRISGQAMRQTASTEGWDLQSFEYELLTKARQAGLIAPNGTA